MCIRDRPSAGLSCALPHKTITCEIAGHAHERCGCASFAQTPKPADETDQWALKALFEGGVREDMAHPGRLV
eukprot:10574917-Alexandrium_andersonii.AAC.1